MGFRSGAIVFAALIMAACGGSPGGQEGGSRAAEAVEDYSEPPVSPAGYETVEMTVPSMSCPLCSASIEARLKEAGLRYIQIDLEAKRVTAAFDPGEISVDEVKALVEGQGFPVTESGIVEQ